MVWHASNWPKLEDINCDELLKTFGITNAMVIHRIYKGILLLGLSLKKKN